MSKGRFHAEKPNTGKKLLLFLGTCTVLLACFIAAVTLLQQGNIESQKENLSSAIEEDITDCYAINGYYPESLEDLKEDYGLSYDEDLFFVDYQVRGANLRPDVTILVRNSAARKGGGMREEK